MLPNRFLPVSKVIARRGYAHCSTGTPAVARRLKLCDTRAPGCTTHTRTFSDFPPPSGDTDFTKLRRLEDANPERIDGIQVNPDGIGSSVLPGNLVYKFYKWSGNTRKVPLELVHGYFWMVNDLRATNGKPTLSNETLIPEEKAQSFPILSGLETLSKVKTDIPYFFIQDECKYIPIHARPAF